MEASDEKKEKDEDTLCGVLGYHPKWLQFFASKKTYCILYGLVGMNQLAIGSYVIATITTIEKRFKMPSQASGVILSGWDIGTIFSSITMAYIGSKGHKTRWVALGTLLVSVACYSQLLSYYVYGAGPDAMNIASHNSSLLSMSSCGKGVLYESDCSEGSAMPQLLMFCSQFLLGMGTSMYWTLGIAYLDDNVRKNKVPMLLAISSTIRLLGGPIGYAVAAKSLQHFADPWVTPTITEKDPRWIGAWWIGWIPFGIIATIFAFLLTLFPRVLPRAAMRMKRKMKTNPDSNLNKTKESNGAKFQGFFDMLKRLFKNPLLMCNTFGYVFYMFGVNGYWTYMPKYMETQFRLTASDANIYTGVVEVISAAIGVMLSGVVVTKLQPSGRRIALVNLIVEAVGVVCVLVNAQLGCHGEHIAGEWRPDRSFNLTETCNAGCRCGLDIPYEPVCHVESSTTYFSPCHAGCSLPPEMYNGTKVFPNCKFESGGCDVMANMMDSICPADCDVYLYIFLVIFFIQTFISSFSHSALVIIQFRTVAPEDKSVSIALSEMMCSLITYIPSPIFYGHLIDKACMVWGSSCGEQGNCWLYYGQSLRYYFNYVAAVFLSIALVFDFGIWKYSKGLELYEDEDSDDDYCEENKSTKSQIKEDGEFENIALKDVEET